MSVYVVSYFYPDGSYAGIIGVYKDQESAEAAVKFGLMIDYTDCTFIITHAEVQ